MAKSQTETSIALLQLLIRACRENALMVSDDQEALSGWLSSENTRYYAAQRLEQAITALEMLNSIGEYIVEHHV